MTDPYAYWRDALEPCDYYDDTIALWPMLRAWLLLRTWRLRFWFAHKVLRRPLGPVPTMTGRETTTTTLDDILKAPYIQPVHWGALLDSPSLWATPLAPRVPARLRLKAAAEMVIGEKCVPIGDVHSPSETWPAEALAIYSKRCPPLVPWDAQLAAEHTHAAVLDIDTETCGEIPIAMEAP